MMPMYFSNQAVLVGDTTFINIERIDYGMVTCHWERNIIIDLIALIVK